MENNAPLKNISFTLCPESLAIIRSIPKSRRSYVVRSLLLNLPDVIKDLDDVTLRTPASITVNGDYLLFLNGTSFKIELSKLKKMFKDHSFYEVIEKIEELLNRKDVVVRHDELINAIYDITSRG